MSQAETSATAQAPAPATTSRSRNVQAGRATEPAAPTEVASTNAPASGLPSFLSALRGDTTTGTRRNRNDRRGAFRSARPDGNDRRAALRPSRCPAGRVGRGERDRRLRALAPAPAEIAHGYRFPRRHSASSDAAERYRPRRTASGRERRVASERDPSRALPPLSSRSITRSRPLDPKSSRSRLQRRLPPMRKRALLSLRQASPRRAWPRPRRRPMRARPMPATPARPCRLSLPQRPSWCTSITRCRRLGRRNSPWRFRRRASSATDQTTLLRRRAPDLRTEARTRMGWWLCSKQRPWCRRIICRRPRSRSRTRSCATALPKVGPGCDRAAKLDGRSFHDLHGPADHQSFLGQGRRAFEVARIHGYRIAGAGVAPPSPLRLRRMSMRSQARA